MIEMVMSFDDVKICPFLSTCSQQQSALLHRSVTLSGFADWGRCVLAGRTTCTQSSPTETEGETLRGKNLLPYFCRNVENIYLRDKNILNLTVMRFKLYSLLPPLFLLLFCLQTLHTNAQCTNRYLDTIFTQVDSTLNIVYTDSAGGTATQELMDIYTPVGDTACLRHLAIFVHGGAFFEGSKSDYDMRFLCTRFAQRGYVCATINYRLASTVFALYDSAEIFTHLWQAVSDMKASIRYFYKDARLTNQWKIDTNSIFIGGSSAGAIAADYVGTVDSLRELAPPFQTICTAEGGIDGNSGNAGYSTKSICIASLAGAVDDTRYLKAGGLPMVFCQGTADGTIPYYCGNALTQYVGPIPTIRFCGSGEMSPVLDSLGVANSLLPFPGSGHVPWDTNAVIMSRADSAVAAFYYQVKCTQLYCQGPSGIAQPDAPRLSVYPNPATDILNINLSGVFELSEADLYDCTGRQMIQQYTTGKQTALSTAGLAQGVYLLRIQLKGSGAGPITQRVVIE